MSQALTAEMGQEVLVPHGIPVFRTMAVQFFGKPPQVTEAVFRLLPEAVARLLKSPLLPWVVREDRHHCTARGVAVS